MDNVGDRHLQELDGLRQQQISLSVSVELPVEVAASPSSQHTLWATINMLARLDQVVSAVYLDCPTDIPIAGKISPLLPVGIPLDAAVEAATSKIDTVPVALSDQRGDVRLVVGPGPAVPGALRVSGDGWCGGMSLGGRLPAGPASSLPFGPNMAAALAVGEVFRAALLDLDLYPAVDFAWYSMWSHEISKTPIFDGPPAVDGVAVNEMLIGVGAVGTICSVCLWAAEGVSGVVHLVDHDVVDTTNLNRYLLFDKRHIGLAKASTAASLLANGPIHFEFHDCRLEAIAPSPAPVLCAVDKNTAKATAQSRWPVSLIMATTNELRAEVVRCDPRLGGPCARCHNPPEVDGESDEDLQAMFSRMSVEEQSGMARSLGVPLEEARRWAELGECGSSGDRVRDALRTGGSPIRTFAVGFVSCAAGTMLAAEAVKEAMGAAVPLSASLQRTSVQFFTPQQSPGAMPYLRDDSCPMCQPGQPAASEWRRRMADWPDRRWASGEDAVSPADIRLQ